MPPIIFVLLNGLFLLLLYVFVARAVRAVVRDVLRAAPQPAAAAARPAPRPAAQPARPSPAQPPRKRRAEPAELVVHPPDGRPVVVPLRDGEIRFGRSSSCTVVLSDTFASDQHARIYRDGGGWVVADLGSTNGTYLNRDKVTAPAPLGAGDQVSMGKTVVEVRR